MGDGRIHDSDLANISLQCLDSLVVFRHRFLMLAMMVTMLSHPRAVHSLEELPDLRCAFEAQIAHSCPQKPLEHLTAFAIRARPVFIALLPFMTKP